MNEQEFLDKWHQERGMYEAWGKYVVSAICESLEQSHIDLKCFLKLDCIPRLKGDQSLLDKAFYRNDKSYDDPYSQIQDKVACRFVVLLVDEVELISRKIQTNTSWIATECRNYTAERERDPLLFTYQSVHYVVTCKEDLDTCGITILAGTPCEIQVRTLLQHAYAELTHDALYKTKTIVEPKVQRTVARSMALIETTDDFFSSVSSNLGSGPSERLKFQEFLDSLYANYIHEQAVVAQKSSITILDEFKDLLTEDFTGRLENFLKKNTEIISLIAMKRNENPLYSQSITIFIIWLIKKRKHRVVSDWPLNRRILEVLASDLFESLDIE